MPGLSEFNGVFESAMLRARLFGASEVIHEWHKPLKEMMWAYYSRALEDGTLVLEEFEASAVRHILYLCR